jgi:hypothetical protein
MQLDSNRELALPHHPPLLAVVDVLTRTPGKIHGWAIAESCGETTPNVYRALERLRLAG